RSSWPKPRALGVPLSARSSAGASVSRSKPSVPFRPRSRSAQRGSSRPSTSASPPLFPYRRVTECALVRMAEAARASEAIFVTNCTDRNLLQPRPLHRRLEPELPMIACRRFSEALLEGGKEPEGRHGDRSRNLGQIDGPTDRRGERGLR